MVEHKLASFANIVALFFFCYFTYKAYLHTSKVETRIRQKLRHFGRHDVKAKLFCQKKFRPVTWAGEFITENFHLSRLPKSRSQTESKI